MFKSLLERNWRWSMPRFYIPERKQQSSFCACVLLQVVSMNFIILSLDPILPVQQSFLIFNNAYQNANLSNAGFISQIWRLCPIQNRILLFYYIVLSVVK